MTTDFDLSAIVALLGAARSADDLSVAAIYAAQARTALDACEETLRRLRVNLVSVERDKLASVPTSAPMPSGVR